MDRTEGLLSTFAENTLPMANRLGGASFVPLKIVVPAPIKTFEGRLRRDQYGVPFMGRRRMGKEG